MGGEIVLYVDELESYPFCRICHEAEFESCKSLEAPCSCSGTVKFAHRDCIQRWCDEKGNTTCEICLKNFEAGYTAPVKKAKLLDAAVTIRGSLEVLRRDRDLENAELLVRAEEQMLHQNDYSDCSSAADRSANCCRLVALVFMALLLVRHWFVLLTGGTEDYPFTLLTLLIAKTSGIVIPMYAVIRLIAAIQNSIHNSIRHRYEDAQDASNTERGQEEEDDQHHLHRVQIHSS